MRAHLVVDASVVLKWFRTDEDLAKEAEFLLGRHRIGEILLCAPDLLLYEVGNVLRTKPDFDEGIVLSAVAHLQHLEMAIFPADWELLQQAIRITFQYTDSHWRALTVYDASYIALAEALDCDMVTADKRSLDCLAGHSLVHLLS